MLQVLGLLLPRSQLHRFGFAYCHDNICDSDRAAWALEPDVRVDWP
jgi:hypothetical protein